MSFFPTWLTFLCEQDKGKISMEGNWLPERAVFIPLRVLYIPPILSVRLSVCLPVCLFVFALFSSCLNFFYYQTHRLLLKKTKITFLLSYYTFLLFNHSLDWIARNRKCLSLVWKKKFKFFSWSDLSITIYFRNRQIVTKTKTNLWCLHLKS